MLTHQNPRILGTLSSSPDLLGDLFRGSAKVVGGRDKHGQDDWAQRPRDGASRVLTRPDRFLLQAARA